MGHPTPVITKLATPSFKTVVIETSNGFRYEADMSSLDTVYCFPASEAEWKKVSVDAYGLALVWSSRFEVHVDQVIGLATKSEMLKNIS